MHALIILYAHTFEHWFEHEARYLWKWWQKKMKWISSHETRQQAKWNRTHGKFILISLFFFVPTLLTLPLIQAAIKCMAIQNSWYYYFYYFFCIFNNITTNCDASKHNIWFAGKHLNMKRTRSNVNTFCFFPFNHFSCCCWCWCCYIL